MGVGKLEVIIVSSALAIVGGISYYGHYKTKNLEHDAIHSPLCVSVKSISFGCLPKIKNLDLDGNGKYESVLLYENDIGQINYQEITKNNEGKLVFGEPKSYK